MAGIENMENQPPETGAPPPEGEKPPGSEVPPLGPQDALANFLARALSSPAFENLFNRLIDERLGERQRAVQQEIRSPERKPQWPDSSFGGLMTRIEDLQ